MSQNDQNPPENSKSQHFALGALVGLFAGMGIMSAAMAVNAAFIGHVSMTAPWIWGQEYINHLTFVSGVVAILGAVAVFYTAHRLPGFEVVEQ